MRSPATLVMTFRASDALVRAVRAAARREGRYVSAFLRLLVTRSVTATSADQDRLDRPPVGGGTE